MQKHEKLQQQKTCKKGQKLCKNCVQNQKIVTTEYKKFMTFYRIWENGGKTLIAIPEPLSQFWQHTLELNF